MRPLVNDIELCTALVYQTEILVFAGREWVHRGKILAFTEHSVQIGERRFDRAGCSFWMPQETEEEEVIAVCG
ncbi:hypothetical protein PM3016_4597 [Paenibacillus mucilaginosus 3016]|uniref:Uncharacterized protein n=2 Tax=Paenibacillus mucilaginosus TaxID=61624 RepID=H6NDK3_9BACL|nr:hypothetical protein [Paenibacillus mucilaginosus]AFC31343.1 hypothetical protein PM3016_4597 [Paenibacillus mucilaginosus 3016]AFH63678.1 hypothetical protein B2K_23835 [Paenibacillus mucilaginosus K02]WFA19905.1 hypothetical protein ERY13_23025 [Paenibacillus mucilaginosus]